MPHPTRRIGRVALLLVLPALVATVPIAVQRVAQAGTVDRVAGQTPGIGKYLGKWNYDQPNPASMTNIAVLMPGGLQAPQVGDIVFTASGSDTVVGRTDVGCTWTFKARRSGALGLDPASQTCHNPTADVWYTINTWTVTVVGQYEKETIRATSPGPAGGYTWELARGARTKTKEYDPPSATRFLGTWQYDAADPSTGQNIRVTRSVGPGGNPLVTQTPEQGQVTIIRDYDNRITAHTPDGCAWTLLTRGNTAHLDPAVQTCMMSATAAVTLRYWAIASDGHRQASASAGVDAQGGNFVVGAATLTKS
jgi:hypothetical protein